MCELSDSKKERRVEHYCRKIRDEFFNRTGPQTLTYQPCTWTTAGGGGTSSLGCPSSSNTPLHCRTFIIYLGWLPIPPPTIFIPTKNKILIIHPLLFSNNWFQDIESNQFFYFLNRCEVSIIGKILEKLILKRFIQSTWRLQSCFNPAVWILEAPTYSYTRGSTVITPSLERK